MVDVVGLRFVTEGEKEALASLRLYQAGIRQLTDLQDKHVAAMNRALREEAAAQRQADTARQRALQSYQQLMGAMNPVTAASQKLAAAQEVVRTAFQQGVISAQQMRAALAQLQAQYKAEQAQRFADAQRKVSDALIHGDATVKRINTDYQLLSERQRQGALTANQHRDAQLALARQLAINNGYLTASGALNTAKALAELRAAQATRDATAASQAAAQAAAAQAQRVQQLRMQYEQGYAAFARARQQIRELNEAKRAGIITTAQYQAQLAALRTQYGQLTGAGNQASLGLNRMAMLTQQAGYQVGDFFIQVQSGTNVLVAFGQQATQLIGTFAMLARTTRMIAIFSGLGILVSIGTAIGAYFMRASGSADTLTQKVDKLKAATDKLGQTFDLLQKKDIAQQFGNMAGDVVSLSQAMLELDKAAQLQNLLGTLDKLESQASAGFFRQLGEGALNIARFVDPFSDMKLPGQVDEEVFNALGFQMARAQFLSYTAEMEALARSGDVAGVVALFDTFINDATDAGAAAGRVSTQGYAIADSMRAAMLAVAEMSARFNGTAAEAERLAAAEERGLEAVLIRTGIALDRVEKDRAESAERAAAAEERGLNAVLTRAGLALDRVDKDIAEAAERAAAAEERGLNAVLTRAGLALDRVDADRAESAERAAAAEERGLNAVRIRAGLALDRVDRLATLQQELALQLAINQYGADSVEVAAMQRAAHEATLRAQQNITEEIILAEMALYDAQAAANGVADASGGITSQLNGAVSAALRLRDAMAAAGRASLSRQDEASVLRAQISAAERGLSVPGAKAATETALELGRSGATFDQIAAESERARAEAATIEALSATLSGLTSPAGAGGGGGGSAQELATLTSITEAMLVRIERERELLGLTGEARRAKELQFQIEEQLRQSGQMATEEAIQNAAAKIAAEEAVNETLRRQQEQMQQIGQVMENALTSAFMAIVDGTKSAEDAFKDMARAIISELFKVLVVQQLVGQFKSGGGGILGALAGGLNMNANGNAFMGGNVVPFARGGVVGSPTMFPMAGGRTGLMGEAGPEAIMPLKRGKDGKLGVASSGGNVVNITQNFSVAANGDESVKRIVAQQVPAIAEATKAAVMDARKRGGQMRATFR
jgi:hypothetical protein